MGSHILGGSRSKTVEYSGENIKTYKKFKVKHIGVGNKTSPITVTVFFERAVKTSKTLQAGREDEFDLTKLHRGDNERAKKVELSTEGEAKYEITWS